MQVLLNSNTNSDSMIVFAQYIMDLYFRIESY